MNVQKFVAGTTRETLRKVRDALGADAIILSNRSHDDGVEILAMAGSDVAALLAPVTEKVAEEKKAPPAATNDTSPAPHDDVLPASLVETAASAKIAAWTPPPVPTVGAIAASALPAPATLTPALDYSRYRAPVRTTEVPKVLHRSDQPGKVHGSDQSARADAFPAPSPEMSAIIGEMRSMRGLLESQLAQLSWGTLQHREPARSEILQELLGARFSPVMARHLIDKLPEGLGKAEGMNWVRTVIARNLVTIDSDTEMLAEGGVFALVGPTGVGKTTTTAKIAARVVMQHGSAKLALITTDGYRVGGHEQLRIYGKILGLMVHTVKDEADLRIALAELGDKHIVLIDTAGVGQRDQMVTEQTAMLCGAGAGTGMNVKRLLCLPATSTGETLDEVVRAYRGPGLDGCIVTKLDEAASLGAVLDTIVREKLNLHYVANGQRVPEDLHVANRDYLIEKAFKPKPNDAYFSLREDELALVMAQAFRTAGLPHPPSPVANRA